MSVVEVVVTFGISTEGGIVGGRRKVDRGTALPAAKHARAQEISALLHGQVHGRVLDGVVEEIVVELRYELLEVPESQESAVESPRWADERITFTTCEDATVLYDGLTG